MRKVRYILKPRGREFLAVETEHYSIAAVLREVAAIISQHGRFDGTIRKESHHAATKEGKG